MRGKKIQIQLTVEHVFGIQFQRAGNLVVRTVGKLRAYLRIGLRNLAYNLDRLQSACVWNLGNKEEYLRNSSFGLNIKSKWTAMDRCH